jgi:predicted chitinase
MQIWTCFSGSAAQTFKIQDVGAGNVRLMNPNSGKCVDVATGSPADGTAIQIWSCTDSNNQKWRPTSAGGAPPPAPPPPPPPPPSGGFASILSEAQFNSMFPNRNPFYSYAGFSAAVASFPGFATTGDTATRKREVAAFLANANHETGGLVHITEIARPVLCGGGECGCAPGQSYYGRGPLQLSWSYNYCTAGRVLGLPLSTDPGLAERDSTVSWRVAIWFWMQNSGAGSRTCHDSMVNGAGFGETIRTINGGLECNGGNPGQVQSRINAFRNFVGVLGVDVGSGPLGC